MLSVAEAGPKFALALEDAQAAHELVEVTQDGRRIAVILEAERYDTLMETLEVMSDAEVMVAIREGLDDLAAGRSHSTDEVARELRERGRL